MARLARLHALGRIAEIRAVQERLADLELQRLTAERRRLETLREEAAERRRSEVAAWSQTLAGSRVNLPLAAAWSGRIVVSDGELRLTGQRLETNARSLDVAAQARMRAQARTEVAETLRTRATRDHARRGEERTLQDVADRHGRGSSDQ